MLRYRVAHRSAAARPGVTRVLDDLQDNRLLYSLLLAVIASGLSLRFLFNDETTYLGKGVVIAVLMLGLLLPLLNQQLTFIAYGIQVLLSICLVMHAKFRGRQ